VCAGMAHRTAPRDANPPKVIAGRKLSRVGSRSICALTVVGSSPSLNSANPWVHDWNCEVFKVRSVPVASVAWEARTIPAGSCIDYGSILVV
jgi:hypothetical protein